MGVTGLLLGVVNIALTAAVLLLIGLIAAWFAAIMGASVPDNVRKMYLVVVLIIILYMVIALLVGLPTWGPLRMRPL